MVDIKKELKRFQGQTDADRSQKLQQLDQGVQKLKLLKDLDQEQNEELQQMETILEAYRNQEQSHSESRNIPKTMKEEAFACVDILEQLKKQNIVLKEENEKLKSIQRNKINQKRRFPN